MKMTMHCWKCSLNMEKVKYKFHGFKVDAWKCPKCKEIIYDEKDIQPVLKYNKLMDQQNGLTVTVGALGKSKMVRLPKITEKLYNIYKGEKLKLELEPDKITIRMKDSVQKN